MQNNEFTYTSTIENFDIKNNFANLAKEEVLNKKILLATGGTGGHIFPALALKKVLEESNFKVQVTADSRFANYHKFDQDHIFIPSANFVNKSPLKIASSLFALAKGLVKSLFLIIKFKPDLIYGFGGYPTYPVMLAASILNKKLILHEANVFLGKVNRLFLWKAAALSTGFKNIYGVKPKYQDKIVYTGNPIRSNIVYKPVVNKDKISLLVIGGSQGAKIFGKIIPDMIVNLPREIKDKLYVYQQVREEDVLLVKGRYEQEGIGCEISHFFKDMDKKYNQADLAICRAGASTVSELIKVGLPAIFIPYPTATDNHQYLNAKEIADLNAGWIVKEGVNSSVELLQIIKQIFRDPNLLSSYSEILRQHSDNANENMRKLVLSKIFDLKE